MHEIQAPQSIYRNEDKDKKKRQQLDAFDATSCGS